MGDQRRRQGRQHTRNIGKAGQPRCNHDAIGGKTLAGGERNRETIGFSIDFCNLGRFYPRHVVLLEPPSIGGEIGDRTGLKSLEASNGAIVHEGKTRRWCRDIRAETVGFQVALTAGCGNLGPELHRRTENSMLNIPRGEMCGEREPVGSSADYRYRDPTQDNFSAYPYREADTCDVERKNRRTALRPR